MEANDNVFSLGNMTGKKFDLDKTNEVKTGALSAHVPDLRNDWALQFQLLRED